MNDGITLFFTIHVQIIYCFDFLVHCWMTARSSWEGKLKIRSLPSSLCDVQRNLVKSFLSKQFSTYPKRCSPSQAVAPSPRSTSRTLKSLATKSQSLGTGQSRHGGPKLRHGSVTGRSSRESALIPSRQHEVAPHKSILKLQPWFDSVVNPAKRDDLWRVIMRDVQANRRLREQGLLKAFANPEYAAAAYEIMLERINRSLSLYRDCYRDTLWYCRRHNFQFKVPNRVIYHLHELRRARRDSFLLTTEVKEVIKVTNSIITRDTLYYDHVVRLASFKINFHRAIRGWADVLDILDTQLSNRLRGRIITKFPGRLFNSWRVEIAQMKLEVKLILDSRMRQPQLPLYHFKRALDFLHDILRSQSAVTYSLDNLRDHYRLHSERNRDYVAKQIWIAAWAETHHLRMQQVAVAFRAVSFFISSRVRLRYDYQSIAELGEAVEAQLPIYVREGLELDRHRQKFASVPLPKIRPNQFSDFVPMKSVYYETLEISDRFDLTGFPPNSFIDHKMGNDSEATSSIDRHLSGSITPEPHEATSDSPQLDNLSITQEHFAAELDEYVLEDETDLPEIQNISFPASHEKLHNHIYGEMLQQAKATQKIEQVRKDVSKYGGPAVLARPLVSEAKLSKVHVYAELLREQNVHQRSTSSQPQPTVQEVQSVTTGPTVKQWHPSYMRRSDQRPQNYGSLLSRFKGFAPLAMPATSLAPSTKVAQIPVFASPLENVGGKSSEGGPAQPASGSHHHASTVSVKSGIGTGKPETSITDLLDRVLDEQIPSRIPGYTSTSKLTSEVLSEYALNGRRTSTFTAVKRVRSSHQPTSEIVARGTYSEEESGHKLLSEERTDSDSSTMPSSSYMEETASFLPQKSLRGGDEDVSAELEEMSQAQAEEMFRLEPSIAASAFDLTRNSDQRDNGADTNRDGSQDDRMAGIMSDEEPNLRQASEHAAAPQASCLSTEQIPQLFGPRSGSILWNWSEASAAVKAPSNKTAKRIEQLEELPDKTWSSGHPSEEALYGAKQRRQRLEAFDELKAKLNVDHHMFRDTFPIDKGRTTTQVRITTKLIGAGLRMDKEIFRRIQLDTGLELNPDLAHELDSAIETTELVHVPSPTSDIDLEKAKRRNLRALQRRVFEKLRRFHLAQEPDTIIDDVFITDPDLFEPLGGIPEESPSIMSKDTTWTGSGALGGESHRPAAERPTEPTVPSNGSAATINVNQSKLFIEDRARRQGEKRRRRATEKAESRRLDLPQAVEPDPATVTSSSSSTSDQTNNDDDNTNINQEVLQELLTLRQEMAKLREEVARMNANVAKAEAPPPTISDVKDAEEKLQKKSEAVDKVVSGVTIAERKQQERNEAVRRVLSDR